MKLYIYKLLQQFPFFLYIKDFFLHIFTSGEKKSLRDKFKKCFQNADDIIIFTALSPFYKMKQRYQQIVLALSKVYPQKTIIYYEMDFATWNPNFEQVGNNLFLTNTLSGFQSIFEDKKILLIATGNVFVPELFSYLRIDYDNIYFDYFDNLESYSKTMYRSFLNSLDKYDKVICSAKLLEEQVLGTGYKKTIYLPNGVNSQDWVVEDNVKLEQVKEKYFNNGRKVIGFYGSIESRLDYDIIRFVMENNMDKDFCFIGPDNGNYLKNNGILELENCKYLGYIKFEELKYYSYCFDIAIIPFKINDSTDAISPVKFFQYLAQGKPVITTGFREMLFHKDYCFIASSKEEFSSYISQALQKTIDNDYKTLIMEYSKKYEWDNLVKRIFN